MGRAGHSFAVLRALTGDSRRTRTPAVCALSSRSRFRGGGPSARAWGDVVISVKAERASSWLMCEWTRPEFLLPQEEAPGPEVVVRPRGRRPDGGLLAVSDATRSSGPEGGPAEGLVPVGGRRRLLPACPPRQGPVFSPWAVFWNVLSGPPRGLGGVTALVAADVTSRNRWQPGQQRETARAPETHDLFLVG